MDNLMYVPISPGVMIEVPVDLTTEEINQRVEKYKENLEKSKEHIYNPKMRSFSKAKL